MDKTLALGVVVDRDLLRPVSRLALHVRTAARRGKCRTGHAREPTPWRR
jgi:hypothetical protein